MFSTPLPCTLFHLVSCSLSFTLVTNSLQPRVMNLVSCSLSSTLFACRYSLHPEDLHLIFNLVSCSSAFATGEVYMPMCLPKFNNTGFLHAHVSYIDEACTTCLLLITNNRDACVLPSAPA
jgi:hypothetical protein